MSYCAFRRTSIGRPPARQKRGVPFVLTFAFLVRAGSPRSNSGCSGHFRSSPQRCLWSRLPLSSVARQRAALACLPKGSGENKVKGRASASATRRGDRLARVNGLSFYVPVGIPSMPSRAIYASAAFVIVSLAREAVVSAEVAGLSFHLDGHRMWH
ncbi:hypothetical protein MRX96_048080 [Rhipicephalus microplus]